MEHGSYPERLTRYLEQRDLPEHTVRGIGHMARHGSMSHQAALELLQSVEDGERHRDAERAGYITPIRAIPEFVPIEIQEAN